MARDCHLPSLANRRYSTLAVPTGFRTLVATLRQDWAVRLDRLCRRCRLQVDMQSGKFNPVTSCRLWRMGRRMSRGGLLSVQTGLKNFCGTGVLGRWARRKRLARCPWSQPRAPNAGSTTRPSLGEFRESGGFSKRPGQHLDIPHRGRPPNGAGAPRNLDWQPPGWSNASWRPIFSFQSSGIMRPCFS